MYVYVYICIYIYVYIYIHIYICTYVYICTWSYVHVYLNSCSIHILRCSVWAHLRTCVFPVFRAATLSVLVCRVVRATASSVARIAHESHGIDSLQTHCGFIQKLLALLAHSPWEMGPAQERTYVRTFVNTTVRVYSWVHARTWDMCTAA